MKSSRKFNEYLFYTYILNLLFFIYFCSFRNFMNFFLPINLVLVMFILLNLISQNYNKKLTKTMIYHKFFENLVKAIFESEKNDVSVVYEGNRQKIDEYPENLLKTGKSFVKNESDELFKFSKMRHNEEFQKVSIEEFKGFEFIYINSQALFENKIVFFSKLFLFLINPNKNEKTVEQENFISDLEHIYYHAKSFLKSEKFKILFEKIIDENSYDLKAKIASILIALCLEDNCKNFKILTDDFIDDIKQDNTEYTSYQYCISVNEKTQKCFEFTLKVVKEFANSLYFKVSSAESYLDSKDRIVIIRISFTNNQ